MRFNEEDFFRQATLQICSSLDLRKVFSQVMEYLQDFIPIESICLSIMEPNPGILRYVSHVTTNRALSAIPEQFMSDTMVQLFPRFDSHEKVKIISKSEDPEMWSDLVRLAGTSDISTICLKLEIESRRVTGDKEVLVCIAVLGENRYTKEHAHLLSLLVKPFSLAVSNYLKDQEIIKLKEMIADENVVLRKRLAGVSSDYIAGEYGGLRSVMQMVRQVATSNTPVLLLGETGVGKEVVADAIHRLSERREGPFIKVNCGALAESLLDAELFGHEKGAFTGAVDQKRGRFERAHGGTIFLDEVGELTVQAQVRMLRVLEKKEFERVGGTKPVFTNVRIISATNQQLEQLIDTGRFRQDLWFRLNVFPIMIPPLRHRKEDIPLLVDHFVEKKSRELQFPAAPVVSRGTLDLLKAYHWPGNVRELENLVERALIINRLSRKPTPLSFEGLLFSNEVEKTYIQLSQDQELASLDDTTRAHILRVLSITNGKIFGPGGAAQRLGINPHTLLGRMKKLGIRERRGSHRSHVLRPSTLP